ncbi:protein-glutamate O-methyltransferase CheR [Phenylobacterium sp.]|uniref:CheR family methyltransferase n=1 Tax=Phenylobacterium sp. TaxID=1871053 RepID=UPI00286C4C9F|nr:protein-glutamate O-methyltransferase CheR [Phenylobacterium sp.]
MTPQDRDLVARLCGERAGLRIEPEKSYLLENRLGPVARREGFASVHELVCAVRDRGEERLIWAAVEAMSPVETAFFRDPAVFELILAQVLAGSAGRSEDRPIRIWAASAGAGQEAYSLAMLLAEAGPGGGRVEIFASDLSEHRLEKAQRGLYSQFEVQRGLSARRLVRHFEAAEEGFAISPRVRATVRWQRANLIEDLGRLGRFDLVLCRNLLNCLHGPARERVLSNLAAALRPGGCLVLGAAEAAPGLVAAEGRPGFFFEGSAAARAAA